MEVDNDPKHRPPLPSTMRAAVVTGFGDPNENVFVRDDQPTPTLMDSNHGDNTDDKDDDDYLIVRVLTCALAPGDARVLSGKTAYVQCPNGPPYIVGSDIAGVVVQVPESKPTATAATKKTITKKKPGSNTVVSKFKVGDYVISRFDEPKPQGGVAEYRKVLTKLTEHCPRSIGPVVACGLSASSMAAKRVVTQYVNDGDRVLVIGGSGAVGTSVIQYAKLERASFIAAVSTQTELCTSLGADRVIDYRVDNWWEIADLQRDKFDVVIDLVNGNNWTIGGRSGLAIDGNGSYVALLSGVETEMEARGPIDIVPLIATMVWRLLWSRINPWIPRLEFPEALRLEDGDLKNLLDDVVQGRLKPVVDSQSPFAFDDDGVRKALNLQKSKHAHGKVVIQIADK